MADDIIVRDSNGDLAVNTVVSTEANVPYNYDECFTLDTNGRRALRVVGSGGGGGDVDTTKVVNKAETMPTADADSLGKVYMYTGTTDVNYTHGYIYECVAQSVYSDSVTFEPATISGTVVTATTGALADLCAEYGSGDITSIVSGTMTYDESGGLLVFVGKDSENATVCTFQVYTQDYEDAGFTFTGTLQDGDVIAFTCTITESFTYSWNRLDVMPAAKPTNIVSISTATVTQALETNTIYNCGEMTSIEITFPATASVDFIAQLNFTSGTTPTAFTSPVGMKWLGDDVSTTFIPTASKRYAIMFFYDGVNYRGIVQEVA